MVIKKQQLQDKLIYILENNQTLRNKFHEENLFLSSENIKQKRQLVQLFITIASGIIAGLLLLKESIIIKNSLFVYSGIAFFLLNVLYGFYYLVWILTTEGKQIDESRINFMGGLENVEKKQIQYLHDSNLLNEQKMLKEQKIFIEKINKIGKKFQKEDKKFSTGLYLLFIIFFLGLVCLILSILPLPF